MKTIKSYLPVFEGFYGSIFESDSAEDDVFENLEEDGIEIEYGGIEFHYKDYMDRVSTACIGSIEQYLKHDGFELTIDFEKVYSPREYNFSNDVIYCTYKLKNKEFKRFVDYCKENIKEFETYLDEKYSSRSGFHSFFSTESYMWFKEYLKEGSDKFERAFAGVLEFYLKNEGYTVFDMYDYCASECGYIDYELKNEMV